MHTFLWMHSIIRMQLNINFTFPLMFAVRRETAASIVSSDPRETGTGESVDGGMDGEVARNAANSPRAEGVGPSKKRRWRSIRFRNATFSWN